MDMFKEWFIKNNYRYVKIECEGGEVFYTDGKQWISDDFVHGIVFDGEKPRWIKSYKDYEIKKIEPVTVKEVLMTSVEKWQNIIEKIENKDIDAEDIKGSCGFCLVYRYYEYDGKFQCGDCPLYRDGYCDNHTNWNVLFWKIYDDLDDGFLLGAKEKSEKMLEKIKEEVRRWE